MSNRDQLLGTETLDRSFHKGYGTCLSCGWEDSDPEGVAAQSLQLEWNLLRVR